MHPLCILLLGPVSPWPLCAFILVPVNAAPCVQCFDFKFLVGLDHLEGLRK